MATIPPADGFSSSDPDKGRNETLRRQLEQYRDSGNPFEPPPLDDPRSPDPLPIALPAEPVPTVVSNGEMFSATWFMINHSPLQHLIFGVILFSFYILCLLPIYALIVFAQPNLIRLPDDAAAILVFPCAALALVSCFVFLPMLMMGAIKRGLYVARGGKGNYRLIFSGARYLRRGIALMGLLGIGSLLTCILIHPMIWYTLLDTLFGPLSTAWPAWLLIPLVTTYVVGTILLGMVAMRLFFSFFFVVDRDLRVFPSLAASWKFTSKNTFALFLSWMFTLLIVYLTMICCYIGLIIGPSIMLLVGSIHYLKITGQPNIIYNPAIHREEW